jgi:hypothetical protein
MPRWILDSGALTHMTSHKELFTQLSSYGWTVTIGDNSILAVEGCGTIELALRLSDGKHIVASFNNILYIPKLLGGYLLSESKLEKMGYTIFSTSGRHRVLENGKEYLYAILDSSSQYAVQQIKYKASISSYLEAHSAFGYPGSAVMENLLKTYPSIILSKPETFRCPSCIPSKSTPMVPHSTHKQALKLFDLVHSDLSGRFSTKSLGENEYYIAFIDDFSCFSWVYFLKKKCDAVKAIKDFTKLIQTQFNTTIKSFQMDNGSEYINSEVETYLADNGIILQNLLPYEHESNGLTEHFNRTIVTKAPTILMDHPKFYLG